MKLMVILLSAFFLTECNSPKKTTAGIQESKTQVQADLKEYSKVYFASGCFWCVEAVFESVVGVAEVVSGYAGGKASTATYSQVSSGSTLHAEAVEIYYDPALINYETLLKVFFGSQDPTTLNRQGPDRGYQYRSAIFYQNDEEKLVAANYINMLNESDVWPNSIVTTLEPFEAFYPAEDYHQNYEKNNPNQPYVRSVSIPRLKRFQAKYPELLKKDH